MKDLGREGPSTGDDRRHRRLRRPVRRVSALKAYDRPLLATSADGVGTKVAIAQALDKHDTIGFDLVGMLVDDLVVCGAEPLFLTDYIATGRVVAERIAAIVKGIAEACVEAGCALIGGETAEHPGLLEPDEYDVAGCDDRRGRGRPAAGSRPGPAGRRGASPWSPAGCTPTATPWSGTCCCPSRCRLVAGPDVAELGRTLGEELLEPTRIYAKACLALAAATEIHAMSHITGGGLAGQPRAGLLPMELIATSTGRPGRPQPVFDLVRGGRSGASAPTSSRPSTAASAWSPWLPADAVEPPSVRAGRRCPGVGGR